MNWKRIITGGLVAGIVLNLGEIVAEPVMGPRVADLLAHLGLPAPAEAAMMVHAAAGLALGVATVWLYAAIRPRYGAGPSTAVVAGIAGWIFSCLLPNVVMLSFGIFTPDIVWLITVWPMVTSVLAAIAGAWIYRESPADAKAFSPVTA